MANSIITTKELTIDSTPKRNKNAKPVFCITDGKSFASVTDAAIFYGSHTCNISQACLGKIATSNGKEFCFVKDLPVRVFDIGNHIQALTEDANAWRAQKAEEERIEAERKANEEAERKCRERIAELEARNAEIDMEREANNAELAELLNFRREMEE